MIETRVAFDRDFKFQIHFVPTYSYIGKTGEGEERTGEMEAANEQQLALALRQDGVYMISAEPEAAKKRGGLALGKLLNAFSGVSDADKILMTRNLEVMFSAGLSLVKALDILVRQTRSTRLKAVLAAIRDRVTRGESFSAGISAYPRIFSELFCAMAQVGEESGTLDESLRIVSQQLTKEHNLKSKIRSAAIYPAIIVVVMLVVSVVMVTLVIPSLQVYFSAISAQLPWYTEAMLAVGKFLSPRWYLILLTPAALAALAWMILKTEGGKRAVDNLLLKTPVASGIIRKNNTAMFIRSLSSLVSAGVPLTRSLQISSRTVKNYHFAKAIAEAEEKIKRGEQLSAALRTHAKLFPTGVIEMMEVGEETGKTSSMLKKLADFYEAEAEAAIEKMSVLIEPLIIIVLGVGAGLFAVSIIQPMYSSLKYAQ